jgi:predicted metal-binding protein
MDTRERVSTLLDRHHISDYRWLDPHQIVVAQWVRMKCTFGCDNFARNATCPPNTPPVADCRRFFDEYTLGAVLHFPHTVAKPEDRHEWSVEVNNELLPLERDVFLAGFPKTFLLFMDTCGLCKHCAGTRDECKRPREARPTLEAMAVDVFSTVRALGFPIEVLTDYSQAMNRYALLLVE